MKMREEHRVPLSKQALEVLDKIEAISAGRELVFPSPHYPSKPLSENTFNSGLARVGLQEHCHGPRISGLVLDRSQRARMDPDVIERQLAHREQNEIRAVYHRTTMADRTKLMQWWADYLAGTAAS